MKKSAVITGIGIIMGLLAAAAALAAWKMKDLKRQSEQAAFEPAESVQILAARTVSWRPTSELSGTVFSIQAVTLQNEIAGTVTAVNFDSGSLVEAGDVMLALDDSTQRADLQAAEAFIRVADANVRVQEAELSLAKSNHKRMEQATESRAAAAVDLDRAASAVESAAATLDRARAEVDQAKARAEQIRTTIAKMTLRAPFRGRTGMRFVQPGQYLAEGTTVVEVHDVADSIYIDFAIPQEFLGRVHPGETVMATSELFGAEPVGIEVVSIDATVNPGTRNIRVRSRVPNPGGRLRQGMSVDIRVPVEDARDYVVIPSTAVRRASYGDHVFAITPGELEGTFRAKQKFVRLGPSVGNDLVVLDGLTPGDEVAAVGSFKLRDGALVTRAPAPSDGQNQVGAR